MRLTKEEMRGPDMQEKNAHKYISKHFIPLTLVDESLTLENTSGCLLVIHTPQCKRRNLLIFTYLFWQLPELSFL